VTCLPLDLAWFSSIRKLADAVLVGWPALHVLINNAGAVLTRRSETVEGFETTLGVNHVGHFLLTTLLLDRIKNSAPARIINVSSRAHLRAVTGLDFGDLQSRRHYRGFLAYSRSKLANIYFTRELARRLEGTEVTANAVHPGLVATRFAQDRDTRWLGALMRLGTWFMLSPEQGADTVVYCASDPELSASGKYFVHRRESTPSRAAQDDDAARRLWEETERWIREGHP
jgi:NAD(P)-dependent dehydrogenase (short-subunit alcohol dehydrogenase family)